MSEAYVPDLSGRVSTRMTLAILGTIAGLATMLSAIVILGVSNESYAPLKSTVSAVPEKVRMLRDQQAKEKTLLQSYGKDPVTGDERIPIDVAMEKVVAEYQQRK